MSQIRIAVLNNTDNGGLFSTPVWFGLHDGSFDIFNIGEAVSLGVERIAEDGTFDVINEEFAAIEGGQGGVLFGSGFGDGTPPVLAPGRVASDVVDIDEATQTELSIAAMVLPSNDAFFGTSNELSLFDEDGAFLGEQNIRFDGDDIYDAGTEVNTELDAAFINQSEADAGVVEGGVVTRHPGFNGSEGNPEGDGDQVILGGVNAVGAVIDPDAADFTQDGFEFATLHVNSVVEVTGSLVDDVYVGGRSDDIVAGGAGDDLLVGRRGWDVLDGGVGDDTLRGNRGADELSGGEGEDRLKGGAGDDVLSGGAGDDRLVGGEGDDVILFAAGDGVDRIRDFESGEDFFVLSGFVATQTVDTLVAGAQDFSRGVLIDLGDGDQLRLIGVSQDEISADDFVFV